MLQEKKIAKLSLLSKTLLASERAKAIAKGEKKEELHDNNSNSATEVTFVSLSRYKMKTNLIYLNTWVITKHFLNILEAACRNVYFRGGQSYI